MYSLRTKDRALAKQRRSEEALSTDLKLREAQTLLDPSGSVQNVGHASHSESSAPLDLAGKHVRAQGDKIEPRGPLLHTTILDQWALERKPRPKTVNTFRSAARRFHEIIGKALSKITRADVVHFKQKLVEQGVTSANIECLLSRIRTLFEFAVENEIISSNPAAGVKIEVKRRKRMPFAPSDLQTIFGTSIFTDDERPSGGKGEAAFWMPVLALFSGARLEELAQLRLQDIKVEEYWDLEGRKLSAPCLSIREDEEDNLELKTERSERLVPIHAVPIKLGFLAYVQSLRARKGHWLFPELRAGTYGKRGAKWGEWFGTFLREVCGISDKRLVFHSFRHTFKDLLRHFGIEEGIQRQLMGHAGRDAADGYGRGYSLYQLVNAMNLLRIPGLRIRGVDC
jgi:integrase